MNSFYKSTASDIGQYWKVSDAKLPPVGEVPTMASIGQNEPEYRRTEKILKNQLVAAKWGQQDDEELDEITAAKKKLDRNAIVAKKFPIKPGQYNIPEPGLKVGSPLYLTTYMDIGKLQPSEFEIQDRYHPLNNKFSNTFSGGPYKNTSLNTAVTISKVHNNLNNF